MSNEIRNLSNEMLEQEIAGYYWQGHLDSPGVRVRERGVLLHLWCEFDQRVARGDVTVD